MHSPLALFIKYQIFRNSSLPGTFYFLSQRGPSYHVDTVRRERVLTTLCYRGTLPSYSSGVVSGVYHPSSPPLHQAGQATAKRPTSASQSNSSNSNSFRLKSDLGTRCSWKFVAIFFMLFSFLLVSALIYTAGEIKVLMKIQPNVISYSPLTAPSVDMRSNTFQERGINSESLFMFLSSLYSELRDLIFTTFQILLLDEEREKKLNFRIPNQVLSF